ncbi:caspase-3-like [Anopheles ziemanni]|uniref:caspase-3-like n=1 Tax=Anopheles coustani TaxID=139045 RepID=UPI002658CB6B|nr:caspase-3-like [Anopheles coustani]XP_058170499.1 caspase-3-like [Anopheles ziemanni]
MAASSAAEKYDLSKKAYVLVLHHHQYTHSLADRKGSTVDLEVIKDFFRAYRTEPDGLDIHENLSLLKVRLLMDGIYQKDFSAYSCLIVIIMSHGAENDTIQADIYYNSKNELVRDVYFLDEDVVEKVAMNRTLDGKPKIFIVNACRGNDRVEVDSAVRRDRYNNSDIIRFQSTFEGHVSYRNTDTGSFFVKRFFEELRKNENLDIYDLNRKLNASQTGKKNYIQNPTMSNTLTKRLIFADLRKQNLPDYDLLSD